MAVTGERKRRWPRRLAIAAVGAACVVVAARAALPGVARRIFERRATAEIGMTVSVGDIDLSLLETWIRLKDCAIQAPEGFERREFLRADDVLLDFDGLTHRSYALVLERVEARGVHVCFERDPALGASLVEGRRIAKERRPGDEPRRPPRNPTAEDVAEGAPLIVNSLSLSDVSVEWIDRKRSGRAPTVRASWDLLRSARITLDRDAERDRLVVLDAGATGFVLSSGEGDDMRDALRVDRATMTLAPTSDRRIFYLDAVAPYAEYSTNAEGKSEWEAMRDIAWNAIERKPLEDGVSHDDGKESKSGEGKEEKRKERNPAPPPEQPRDIVVTVAVAELARRAVVEGVERVETLRDVAARVELGENDAEHISLSARARGGAEPAIDFHVDGTGLTDKTATPNYEGHLVLRDFPWHVALWPTEKPDDDEAIVRNALVSGSADFATSADGSRIDGSLRFSEIDARRDRRSGLKRLVDGGTKPATWLAEMAEAYGPSPEEIAFSADSDDGNLGPLAMLLRLGEAFARARVEMAEEKAAP